jgi:hypothetical protein
MPKNLLTGDNAHDFRARPLTSKHHLECSVEQKFTFLATLCPERNWCLEELHHLCQPVSKHICSDKGPPIQMRTIKRQKHQKYTSNLRPHTGFRVPN